MFYHDIYNISMPIIKKELNKVAIVSAIILVLILSISYDIASSSKKDISEVYDNVVRLTDMDGWLENFVWSPDGQWLYFENDGWIYKTSPQGTTFLIGTHRFKSKMPCDRMAA